MVRLLAVALLSPAAVDARAGSLAGIRTVFLIMMENRNWATLQGSTNAPYLTQTLLPLAAHAEQYYNPPGLHPSLPNYLWLEAGTNFGVTADFPASALQLSATNHLVTLLDHAGISWKGYFEDLPANGATNNVYPYVSRHNPFVYFTNVSLDAAYATARIRPYPELETDLQQHTVARYNFIAPNMCNDMHDACNSYTDPIRASDDWLASELPKILSSEAYREGGVIFLLWDEGDGNISDGPIGMFVLSPLAKGGGYANTNYYTHSSMLRTLQEVFGVTPLLGDAINAMDLSDFFRGTPLFTEPELAGGQIQFTLLTDGRQTTNEVQVSTDLRHWTLLTRVVGTNLTARVQDAVATNGPPRFYRAVAY